MCLLTYFPPKVDPDFEALERGALINNDGHGYAIVVPDKHPKLIVRRSLNADQLLEQLEHDRAKYPDGPALFHSRWGTSGEQSKFNCHPFYVNGDRKTIVAHNGVLPSHMQPAKHDPRCDTRMAADDIFGNWYGHLSTRKARQRLAADIGTYNKLVILTINPKYKNWSYIINEQQGIWDGGIWYSNFDYEKPPADTKNTPYYATGKYSDEPTDCLACGAKESVDSLYDLCDVCDTCAACMQHMNICLCFTGEYEPTREWWVNGQTKESA